jgi:hypothetical protein
MKNLIVFFLLFFSLSSYSQDKICDLLPSKDGKVFYSDIIVVDKLKSEELYNNTKLWISQTFRSAKSVIEADVENNLLVMKGRLNYVANGDTPFSLSLQFKDGRYKYELTDFESDIRISSMHIKRKIEETPFVKNCEEKGLRDFNSLIESFIKSMIDGINKNDDW